MRKLLNTLYVTTPDSFLHRDGENVIVKVGSEEKFRIPVHNIEGIVCFGYMGASPHLMELCSENNVGLSFLTPQGKFLGRVNGRVRGNVLLRRTQYRGRTIPLLRWISHDGSLLQRSSTAAPFLEGGSGITGILSGANTSGTRTIS